MGGLPILLIPGLNCSARVFAHQIPALWPHGSVFVANHTKGDDDMASIARAILADAPPKFCLAGFSMGGYIAFEILRQAPERVGRLALLDTSAQPDNPEQTERRRGLIAMAREGRFAEVPALQFANIVGPDHAHDQALFAQQVTMAEEVGPQAFIRHQQAIITRPDSRDDLRRINVPTLVIVGENDRITAPEAAQEMAGKISGASLVTVPRAGHLALCERPEAVNAALEQWVSG